MKEFAVSIDIQAPPERVYAVMVDVARWPEWTPTVTKIERLTPGPFAAGSRTRVVQPGFPPAIWQTTELIEGRSFTWVSGAPGMRVTARHSVEPREGGSRATLCIQYAGLFGPLFGWLTRDANNRYIALEAKGLKSRSEEGRP
ncbi:MAG TPA: SRPBCC family protein [Candidatus Eisenbacteria bacterium]|nr:SRPBCC family protein [Candidatus Eisenbacteria bacterium]